MLIRKYVRIYWFIAGMVTVLVMISTLELLFDRSSNKTGFSRRGSCVARRAVHDIEKHNSRSMNEKPSDKNNGWHQTSIQVKRNSSSTKIDMVNGFHPFVDFSLNFPQVMPVFTLGAESHFLIVLINSAARGEKYRQRRAAIRKTWGSHNTCEQQKMMGNEKLSKLKWLKVFVLAKAGPGTDDDERNQEEAKKYNDMLIGNFPDRYLNNVLKLYMAQLWAATFRPSVEYTFKVDDDVYVRIPKVVEYLSNRGFPKRFYGGYALRPLTVDRRPEGKWAVSWKYYPEKKFPYFNVGAFILMSTDLLPYLFNYVHVRKPFHTDDAYVGVAMRDSKVRITFINSFYSRTLPDVVKSIKERSDCQTLKLIGVAHNVENDACMILHDRIETMCTKNMTISTTCNE